MSDFEATATTSEVRYLAPGWFLRNVFNRFVNGSARRGISVWGSWILEVPGRVSGEIRSTPVNVLTIDDRRFLVAPRGVTQWVLNARAAGAVDLRVGQFFDGVGPDATDEEFLVAAPNHPVFELLAPPTT